MRFQRQTIFGKPNGNCFATCVACIFDLEVEAVPNFGAGCSGGEWFERFEAWCRPRGYFPLNFRADDHRIPKWVPSDAVIIVGGPAARGLNHAVLYRGAELLWDPHPDNTGVDRIDDFQILVPLDPGALALVTREAA